MTRSCTGGDGSGNVLGAWGRDRAMARTWFTAGTTLPVLTMRCNHRRVKLLTPMLLRSRDVELAGQRYALSSVDAYLVRPAFLILVISSQRPSTSPSVIFQGL